MLNREFIDIGTGIYTPPEIENIIGLNKTKARRWLMNLKKNISDKSIFFTGEKRELVTNFLTMMELNVFQILRDNGITPKRIYAAYNLIRKNYNIAYPFAHKKLAVYGKKILIVDDAGYILAEKTEQYIFEAVKEYFKKIEFDNDMMAVRYFPLGIDKSIVINPHIQFGQPVINGTRIQVNVLYDYYKSGESIENISDMFGISGKNVTDAINYFERQN